MAVLQQPAAPPSVRSGRTLSPLSAAAARWSLVERRRSEVSPDLRCAPCWGASLGADRRDGNTDWLSAPAASRLPLRDDLTIRCGASSSCRHWNQQQQLGRLHFVSLHASGVKFTSLGCCWRGGQRIRRDTTWCRDYYLLERPWWWFLPDAGRWLFFWWNGEKPDAFSTLWWKYVDPSVDMLISCCSWAGLHKSSSTIIIKI